MLQSNTLNLMPKTMPRTATPLTHARVKALRHSGKTGGQERHADGNGLALAISTTNAKSWVQAITIHGTRRTFGLGPFPLVSLAEAREKAASNRKIALDGGDPRRPKRRPPTFREAAEQTIALLESGWRNSKSRAQWQSSLNAYAHPAIGEARIDQITSADVLAILTPIWGTKRETAQRVRQRISAVMRFAIAAGHRADNPAGEAVLSALPRQRPPVKHHAALPHAQVADAIRLVHRTDAWIGTKLTFEFLVLMAARSGEVRGAVWDEFDFEAATWTIPAQRMKANAEHRVPLSSRAIDVLRQAKTITSPPMTPAHRGCKLVFPSAKAKPISDSTVSKLLRDNGIKAVPHGFRSSFRDWAQETTDTPHAVMEAALAHTIPSAVERAYARSDLFDRRRKLMDQWAEYVKGKSP